MKKLILGILLFFVFQFSVSAQIEIHSDKEDIENIVEIKNGVAVVYGNVVIGDNYTIDYPLEIYGDLETKNYVKISENITVHGDVKLGNYTQLLKHLSAENIETNLRVKTHFLEAQNITIGGENIITGGVKVAEDFEAGSDLELSGYSLVEGNFSVSKDAKITGTLVVLGNARGHFDFIFQGGKLVVRGDFRTLEDSKLSGRIYMFASEGHRYKYGNKVWKHRYLFSKVIYKDFFGKVDPFLQYNLTNDELSFVREIIQKYDKELEEKQAKYLKSSGEIKEIYKKEIEKTLENKFQYVSQYIGDNNWQMVEFKKLQYEEKNGLKEFFAQMEY